MKHFKTRSPRSGFHPLEATRQAQAAIMTLQSGAASDDQASNEHPRCEQWLFVISGAGVATIGRSRRSLHRVKLQEGSLLLIERGELHQIRNTGRRPLRTLNLYVPPAYSAEGDVLPSAQRAKRSASE